MINDIKNQVNPLGGEPCYFRLNGKERTGLIISIVHGSSDVIVASGKNLHSIGIESVRLAAPFLADDADDYERDSTPPIIITGKRS